MPCKARSGVAKWAEAGCGLCGVGAVGAAAGFEEGLEDGGAVVCQHAGSDFETVVEAAVADDVVKTPAGAGLRVGAAVDKPVEPGQDQRAGAHRAGFERDVDRAAVQSPQAQGRRGLGQGDDLGVGGRVLELLALVVGLGDDAVLVDDHGPDGHVAVLLGHERGIDGHSHVALIDLLLSLIHHARCSR